MMFWLILLKVAIIFYIYFTFQTIFKINYKSFIIKTNQPEKKKGKLKMPGNPTTLYIL